MVDAPISVCLAFTACRVCCVCLPGIQLRFFQAVGTFAALWNKSSALFQGMRFQTGRMLVQHPLNGPTVFEMFRSDWQRDFIIVIISLSFYYGIFALQRQDRSCT